MSINVAEAFADNSTSNTGAAVDSSAASYARIKMLKALLEALTSEMRATEAICSGAELRQAYYGLTRAFEETIDAEAKIIVGR